MAVTRRLPRSVLVLGQRFKVKGVRDLKLAPGEAVGDTGDEPLGVLGVSDLDAQVILIETDQGADGMAETLVHECLHAILGKAGFGLDMSPDVQEAVVKRTAPILLDFIRRNPAVYTYITGRYTYR